MCVCIYIYIYIERERERDVHMYMCVYIYIYIYIHIKGALERLGAIPLDQVMIRVTMMIDISNNVYVQHVYDHMCLIGGCF